MRKTGLILCFLFAGTLCFSQSAVRKLPVVNVKTLSGKTVSTGKLSNDGKPIIISFWATWCKPCVKELNAIQDVYEDWTEETGVKLIAVSIDDTRNTAKVGPFVNGKGWDFEIVLDANRDFSRAMSVNTIPHTFLLNGKGEIVWQHTTYSPGDEDELYEMVKKVAEGKSLE